MIAKQPKALIMDVETIGEDFDALDETTQEVLTRWIKKEHKNNEAEYMVALDDLKEGLGFSPLTGEIVALGMMDSVTGKIGVYYHAPGEAIEDFEEDKVMYRAMTEKDMLVAFWEKVKQYDEIVTFNGYAFDLPYVMTRSLVHEVRASVNIMSNRYMGMQRGLVKHVDLADQLTFYSAMRRKGTLHAWCRACGIKSPKGDVCGDDVKGLFTAKRYLDIARYNVGDLLATKELYAKWCAYLRF